MNDPAYMRICRGFLDQLVQTKCGSLWMIMSKEQFILGDGRQDTIYTLVSSRLHAQDHLFWTHMNRSCLSVHEPIRMIPW